MVPCPSNLLRMKDMINETDIRKAVLVAVAKKYQKFNDKNPTGQEILDRALVRYDPVSDEFHPNDIGWIDSQQAYYKLHSAGLKIDPAAFDELCEGGAPSAPNVQPMNSSKPSNEIMANIKARANGSPVDMTSAPADDDWSISAGDRELLGHHLSEIGLILKRMS